MERRKTTRGEVIMLYKIGRESIVASDHDNIMI